MNKLNLPELFVTNNVFPAMAAPLVYFSELTHAITLCGDHHCLLLCTSFSCVFSCLKSDASYTTHTSAYIHKGTGR